MGSNAGERVIKVLVTGFEAFRDELPINPSFEVAKRLPSTIKVSNPDVTVQVVLHPTAIPVKYEEVRTSIPKLLKAHQNDIDIVLHIGMAVKQKFYCIERSAHRDDYSRNKDVDGEKLPASHGRDFFSDCPRNIVTTLAYEKLWNDWLDCVREVQGKKPTITRTELQQSEDAGHFLCDYIYLTSLAWYGRENGSMTGGSVATRPVIFLHVPEDSDEVTLQRGEEVANGLIRAMAKQFVDTKS